MLVPDAVRLPPRRDGPRVGGTSSDPIWLPDLPAVQPRGGLRASTARRTSAGPGPRVIDGIEMLAEIFDPAAFVDIAPPGQLDAGPGRVSPTARAMPFRPTFACLWCGTAHTCRGPGRPRGLGAALPRLPRQGRRQRVPAVPAAPGPRGARCGRTACDAPSATAPAEPAAAAPALTADRRPADRAPTDDMVAYYEARAAEYDDWYLRRGRYARGADPRRGLERRARRGRPLARRPAARRPDRRARRGHGLVVAAPRRQGRAVDVRRGARRRSTAPASASSRIACAPTSTSATRGPSRTAVADALFTGFWLSHVERERLGEFLELARRWLRPAGAFAFIDSLPDRGLRRGRPPGPRRRPRGPPARRRPRVHDRQGLPHAGGADGGPRRRPASGTSRSRRPAGSSCSRRASPAERVATRRRRRGARAGPPDRAAVGRWLYSARCPPCRAARSPPSAPASWPRR